MDFDDRCAERYRALPEEQRAEVRSVVGLIPDWMVVSLERANIPVISVDMTDGHMQHGYLMPTALMIFLADTTS